MKLRGGDMMFMEERNGMLKLRIIGRDDVPRVERKGYGWSDGATVLLKGADVAEFQDALDNTFGEYAIGDSGLSVKIEYNIPHTGRETPCLILSAKDVSVKLTWPERTLLVYAVQSFAWRMFT